jgi:hypothetical protein
LEVGGKKAESHMSSRLKAESSKHQDYKYGLRDLGITYYGF